MNKIQKKNIAALRHAINRINAANKNSYIELNGEKESATRRIKLYNLRHLATNRLNSKKERAAKTEEYNKRAKRKAEAEARLNSGKCNVLDTIFAIYSQESNTLTIFDNEIKLNGNPEKVSIENCQEICGGKKFQKIQYEATGTTKNGKTHRVTFVKNVYEGSNEPEASEIAKNVSVAAIELI